MTTHVVQPGREFRGVRLGESSSDQVYEIFGRDCETQRSHLRKDEVLRISYLYDEAGNYDASREANRDRPDQIVFESGYVIRMGFGVYQKECFLPGSIRTGMTREEIIRQFGEDFRLVPGDKLDKMIFLSRGLEVWIHNGSSKVNSFYIFRPVGVATVRETPQTSPAVAATVADDSEIREARSELETARAQLAEVSARLEVAEQRATESERRAFAAEQRAAESESRAIAAEQALSPGLSTVRPGGDVRVTGRRPIYLNALVLALSVALAAGWIYWTKA